MSDNNFPYQFKHLETSLIAFIADLEKKIQRVYPNIPLLMYNVDDSYILLKKYKKNEIEELYHVLPRVMLDIITVQAKMDENGSQYIRMNYIHDDEIYNTQFRQVVTGMTITINLVSSNFLKMLEYWEFLVTLFCIDNTFTYEYMGNNYGGRYIMSDTPENEKPPMSNSTSDAKNYITKLNVELSIKPSFVRLETIKKTTEKTSFIIDTDILIDDNGNPIDQTVDVDNNGIVILNNSKPNSQQDLNDIGLSSLEEKKLLKNRRYIKTSANKFDITSTSNLEPEEIHKTTLNINQYKKLE